MNKDHISRKISVEKITLNIGCGKDQTMLDKAERLLKALTSRTPVRTYTQKRIAAWGLRPGLPIGCKITLRKDDAIKMIPRVLAAKELRLKDNNFDENGNVSFGIPEYIDIKDAKYDPDIGIIGLQCSITLKRPGFRIKIRKIKKNDVPMRHRIPKDDAKNFMKDNFSAKIGDIEE